MVESVLEEITLWTDEYVTKETTEVFAELCDIEYFHFKSAFCYFGSGCWQGIW